MSDKFKAKYISEAETGVPLSSAKEAEEIYANSIAFEDREPKISEAIIDATTQVHEQHIKHIEDWKVSMVLETIICNLDRDKPATWPVSDDCEIMIAYMKGFEYGRSKKSQSSALTERQQRTVVMDAQDDYNWDAQQGEIRRKNNVIASMLNVLEDFVSSPTGEGKMKLERKMIKVIAQTKELQA